MAEVKHWVCSDCVQKAAYHGHMRGCATHTRWVNCLDCKREIEAAYLDYGGAFMANQRRRMQSADLERQRLVIQAEIYRLRHVLRRKRIANRRAPKEPPA